MMGRRVKSESREGRGRRVRGRVSEVGQVES